MAECRIPHRAVVLGISIGLLALRPASSQGISWPAGQVVPRFADYSALDVVDISGLSFDRKLAVTALQGLVNRHTPRIYVLDAQQFHEGKTFWLDRIPATKSSIADPLSLFIKYRSEVSGLCVYDPAVPGTLNVAATAAGVTGCAVASPALAQTLGAGPYGFSITLDLRSRFADDRAAYAWAKSEFWSRCSHRMLAGMRPGVHYPLYDYTVANRVFCAWLAPENALDLPLLNGLFADMPVNGVYMGWWAGETSGVGYASRFGVMTFASDWFANGTVHGGGPSALAGLPELAPPPPAANKCYIALILSDGDNIQEQEHLFPIRWRSALRGTFPVSWTQSPALADFAPAMLNYYYATRTANDCFLTGPSGVGYVLPEKMDGARLREFARLTEIYLKRTGIRSATIWGNSPAASDTLGLHCPSLLGMANHVHQEPLAPRGFRRWAGGLVSLEMDPDYASFATQITPVIDRKLASWDRRGPLFIAPQLNTNVAGLEELKKVYDAFKDNPDVVFVRADQLFQLMRGPTLALVPPPAASRPGLFPLYGNGAARILVGTRWTDLRGRSRP